MLLLAVLKAYEGTFYSYGHKESVNTITQKMKSTAPEYPKTGEIDIMPYYTNWLGYNERKRMVAAQKDLLSLIWLTKIELK